MAIELVLDASVSLAWFLKETPERAAYAAAINAAAADGAVLHVPVQWGIEVGHVLLREYRRKGLRRGKLRQALEDLESFDIRTHVELYSARQVVELAERYHLQGYDALYFDLARVLKLPLATLDDGHRQAATLYGSRFSHPSDASTGRWSARPVPRHFPPFSGCAPLIAPRLVSQPELL